MAASAPTATVPARWLWIRVGVIVGAVLVGLCLNYALQGHLATLAMLARTDPIAARAELAREVRSGGLAIFATVGALGLALVAASRRAIRDEIFPPPGAWSWGAIRTVTGASARRIARVTLVLAIVLVLAALAGGWVSWEMGTRLLACRAGVPPATPGH